MQAYSWFGDSSPGQAVTEGERCNHSSDVIRGPERRVKRYLVTVALSVSWRAAHTGRPHHTSNSLCGTGSETEVGMGTHQHFWLKPQLRFYTQEK